MQTTAQQSAPAASAAKAYTDQFKGFGNQSVLPAYAQQADWQNTMIHRGSNTMLAAPPAGALTLTATSLFEK